MATTLTKPAPVAGLAQGILVILAGFLPILAIVALTPVVPAMVGHFAGGPSASTLVPLAVTAPGLMIALFSPLMGWLADRYGRRNLLIWATFIYGFVGVVPYFLESLTAIFASRLALGLCEAAILTITNTLIADYYPEAGRRNWLMAQAAFGPIFGVSVLIGSGQLAAFNWHLPFLIYAVALPIAGAMAIWLFEPDHKLANSAVSSETFPTRHIAVCGGVTLFGASLYYVYIVQIGLAFEGIGLHAADKVGMLVGLANIGVFLGGLAFKPLSSEEQQASALVFRTRDLLVRQRTQTINAIRGHMTEYGWVAPKGPSWVTMLGELIDDDLGASLPHAAREMFRVMLDMLEKLDGQIADLDKEIARRAREDDVARRLMTIPGIGPIAATAIAALAPAAQTFKRGRDFAAWLGLTPLQRSTGGKTKLGRTSKMGERTLRRLLIIGSSSVILHASRRGAPEGSWLAGMLARKPRMLVTVAQANKTARIVWALLMKNEDYRAPMVATA